MEIPTLTLCVPRQCSHLGFFFFSFFALVGTWTPTNNQCWSVTGWWIKHHFSPIFFTTSKRLIDGRVLVPKTRPRASSRLLCNPKKNLNGLFFSRIILFLLHHWCNPNHKTQTNQVAAISEWERWNIELPKDLLDVIYEEHPLFQRVLKYSLCQSMSILLHSMSFLTSYRTWNSRRYHLWWSW